MDPALAGKADRLRALHAEPGVLVLPNAWDAASATALEAAGFPDLGLRGLWLA